MRKFLILGLGALSLAACVDREPQSADAIQREETAQMVAEAQARIGTADITNFTERRWVQYLYELRDETFTTYSYYMDMQGDLHFLCESLGYGINASIQFTNPERPFYDIIGRDGTDGRGGNRWSSMTGMIPQPEPNGLFMPEGLAATYVLCSDGEGGVEPVYWEPELIVSPFPLRHVGDVRANVPVVQED